MPLKLIVANKAYSSWSLRAWILLAHFKIPFEETVIPLDLPETRRSSSSIRRAANARR